MLQGRFKKLKNAKKALQEAVLESELVDNFCTKILACLKDPIPEEGYVELESLRQHEAGVAVDKQVQNMSKITCNAVRRTRLTLTAATVARRSPQTLMDQPLCFVPAAWNAIVARIVKRRIGNKVTSAFAPCTKRIRREKLARLFLLS